MGSSLQVAFCCNGDDGGFRGRCEAIRVDDGADCLIALDGFLQRSPAMRREGRVVYVGGKAFALVGPWKEYAGHLAWDAAPMALVEVRRLLESLLARGFSVDQGLVGGPFEYLLAEKAVPRG
jgi:hypothetical protein